jgi:hypothetical protein
MPYFVIFDEPLAASIDEGVSKSFELADAVTHAFQLIDDNRANVTIRDDKGNSISGEDLLACWRGDKKITSDLKAV